jgi:hypothetical protein
LINTGIGEVLINTGIIGIIANPAAKHNRRQGRDLECNARQLLQASRQ